MKDYKIKENICNLRQSIDHLKDGVARLEEKFDVLVEILTEKENDEREAEENE